VGKDFGSETIEGVASAAQQNQVQVTVDDASAPVSYAATVRIMPTAEEINIDFAGGIRPTGPQSAVLKIDQRIVMNPWAAKRLAIILGQTIQRYEEAYGVIELDERKRRQGPPLPMPTNKPS
jgi:hypothetical protein